MQLILGGSGSGKSAYAEQLAFGLANGQSVSTLFYIATMQVSDSEAEKKVARHRRMRKEKAFHTIEQPRNIGEVAVSVKGGVVLLECLSNLVANELFSTEKRKQTDIVEQILSEIRAVMQTAKHLVIVSNNVFEDGIRYDTMTEQYIQILGKLNQCLAAESERTIEVVYGIPVEISRKE